MRTAPILAPAAIAPAGLLACAAAFPGDSVLDPRAPGIAAHVQASIDARGRPPR